MMSDTQVKRLRIKLMEGKTLEGAAMASGMSERTARKWQRGAIPSETKEPRSWRTRTDPFEAVWGSEIEPLLESDENGVLEAQTIMDVLEKKHPGQYDNGQLRTMQRRIRDWRALHGPNKVVKFPQQHVPGREGSFDFTHCTELGVTILGKPFAHLIFEFVLSFSGWTWIMLAFGETFEAMVAGIQGALWELDGVPEVLRHDNLSAATHELARGAGRSLNRRYEDVLDHYGLKSSRIRPGESHENGVAEKAHHLLKSQLEQALVIRGSRDFSGVDEYMTLANQVVQDKRNRGIEANMAQERAHLHALPGAPVPCYTSYDVTVRGWSTILVAGRIYSVPSRLIGHEVKARVHPDVVEVWYRNKLVETMPRLRGEDNHLINYHHIIWSLVRKPGAFARYRYREDLFPTLTFRQAYDALRESRGDRADVEYVRILHLAASTTQSQVQCALDLLLETGSAFDYVAVKSLAQPQTPSIPSVIIPEPDLARYDALLTAVGGGA